MKSLSLNGAASKKYSPILSFIVKMRWSVYSFWLRKSPPESAYYESFYPTGYIAVLDGVKTLIYSVARLQTCVDGPMFFPITQDSKASQRF